MPTAASSRKYDSPSVLGSRLDCWKEIAAHLGRSERTVKRWEVDRGLPVHRVPGGARSSVYAFTAELDRWLRTNGRADVELKPHPAGALESVISKDPFSEADEAGLQSISPADAKERARNEPVAVASPSLSREQKAAARQSRLGWLTLVLLLAVALSGIAGPRIRSAIPRATFLGFPSLAGHTVSTSISQPAASESEKRLSRELYLQGRYEWNQRSPESLTHALDDFTQSLVHDPGYALAYVGLADTYNLLQQYTTMPEGEAFSRAMVAAKKAVALNDSLAEAHRALAFAEMYGAWDFRVAEKEFRRAIELDPNDPVARRWYANAFAVRGRFEESLEQINMAQELDPTSHATLADKGVMLFDAGHTQEGIRILKEVEHAEPGFRSPHQYMARISFETGDYLTYLEEGRKTAELSNDAVLKDVIDAAQRGYSKGGAHGLLENIYAKQKQYVQSDKMWAASLADTCIHMGRKKEAVQLLEMAYARHEEYAIASMLSHPDYIALKDESGYQVLVRKINFPMPN
jgi:tetratricopeptide (TPR) repeat protein